MTGATAATPARAYADLSSILADHRFHRGAGGLYFGDESEVAVVWVRTTIDRAKQRSWFTAAVTDMRMLRIAEDGDLLPAVINGSNQRSR